MSIDNNCLCGITIKCPIEKREILIKHSIYTHNISLEICKEESYKRVWTIFDRDTFYKRCIIDLDNFAKTLWTTVYLEKNTINTKDILINDIYHIVTDNSAETYNNWLEWYSNYSDKFYDLTKRSYPQLGTILLTNRTSGHSNLTS